MEEKNFEDKKINKIEKIESVDQMKKTEISPFAESEEIAPSKTKFDIALQRADEAIEKPAPREKIAPVTSTEGTLLSPIHEMSSRSTRLEPVTREKIMDKAIAIQEKIATTTKDLETTLQKYPDIKVTPASEAILSEKLIHVDSTLRSSLNLVGAEATSIAPAATTTPTNPLVNFLTYLTHGDKQMKALMRETAAIGNDPKITPGKLISIQIKLNFVQQEIEFFSSALNKALESAKTIMNVQI